MSTVAMSTMIKFHNVKYELPEVSGEYLCYLGPYRTTTLSYSAKHKRFNVHDFYDEETVAKYAITNVQFWAEKLYLSDEDE